MHPALQEDETSPCTIAAVILQAFATALRTPCQLPPPTLPSQGFYELTFCGDGRD